MSTLNLLGSLSQRNLQHIAGTPEVSTLAFADIPTIEAWVDANILTPHDNRTLFKIIIIFMQAIIRERDPV